MYHLKTEGANMTAIEQKTAAKKFAEYWKDKGDEKQETSRFWIELLGNVFGVEEPTKYIEFEKPVMVEKNQKYIDGYIPTTKILIEQKGSHIKLNRTAVQSDGEKLTPYGQAFRYKNHLSYDEQVRWIIVCNFSEFLVYDMNKPNDEPEQILLKDLPKEYYRLQFLVDKNDNNAKKEMEISLKAGKLVGKIYDAILKQYKNPNSEETLKNLNMLCVRLVFCLYAEDAGIFGRRNMFHDYLESYDAKNVRMALIELFKVLDQKDDERDPYLIKELAEFPYVNGGLFKDDDIEIPNFNDEILDLLLSKASADFDWSLISPTIFGAVFESTLNPETRRKGGMHYTSVENIHKVIDPLFLDDLNSEFKEIMESKQINIRKNKLYDFQEKLSKLTFLDPACGSGNFLTETYLSLRRLENNIIREIIIANRGLEGQTMLGGDVIKPIQVSINQFYGIEINDFAVSVAKTALWIAENQMMKETEEIIEKRMDFLPLTNYANIIEGNALRIDWESVVPKKELNYIMGNPPFIGYKLQTLEQKNDLMMYSEAKNIDYVAGWYFKASEFMQDTNIRTAFVSTNSITQGEQVAGVWKPLYDRFGIHIDFAYRTFRWDNRGKKEKKKKKKTDNYMAAVHCVIIGFSVAPNHKDKYLYDNDRFILASNINPYLIPSENIFVEKRNTAISERTPMVYGSEPREGGFLILSPDERAELLHETPNAVNFIKQFVSSEDYINNKIRYCLWFENAQDVISMKKSKIVSTRLKNCAEFRENSKQKQANSASVTPYFFASPRQPKTDYLLIPIVSSERRRYIPIGYVSKDIIASNACFTIANANLLTFGIITSNVHMVWVRTVCGRLKSDYRYSNTIVYNNFPWCEPTPEQKAKIEQTAQAILDARAKYPDCSLADLYDELTMPPELRKAHQQNDLAVMAAYGFDRKITESECVAELMGMYVELTEGR